MISPRKAQANRTNARLSTGPRSAAGRARAACNARRHGLNVPVVSDPALSAEVEALARLIAEEGEAAQCEFARAVAEAQVDLIRVRRARYALLAGALREGQSSGGEDPLLTIMAAEVANRLAVLDRYERRALARRKFAIRSLYTARAAAPITHSET